VQGVLVQTLGIYLASSGQGSWRDDATTLLKMPQLYAVGAALALRWAGPELVTSSENAAASLFQGV